MQHDRQPLMSANFTNISNRECPTRKKNRKGSKNTAAAPKGVRKPRQSDTSRARAKVGLSDANERRQENRGKKASSSSVSKKRATNSRLHQGQGSRRKPTSYERQRYVMTFGGLEARSSAESQAAPLFPVGTSFCLKKCMTGQELSELKAATSGDVSVRPAAETRNLRVRSAVESRISDNPKVVASLSQLEREGTEMTRESEEPKQLYMDEIICYEDECDMREIFEDNTNTSCGNYGTSATTRALVGIRTGDTLDGLIMHGIANVNTCGSFLNSAHDFGANGYPPPSA